MFRFTIRDLLFLTLAVAIAVAWLVEHRGWQTERAKMLREMEVLKVVARTHEAESITMERIVQLERAKNQALAVQIEELKADNVGR